MPAMEPRKYTLQREIEHMLKLLTASEATEITARVMASIMAREPSRFVRLAELFKQSLDAEYNYLIKHRHGGVQQDDPHYRGVS
jgi:hypothetical protein